MFNYMKSLSVHLHLQEFQWLMLVITLKHHVLYMLLLIMVQYFLPEAQQQLLLSISKNNSKPVLKYVLPHEISFSTSVPARI